MMANEREAEGAPRDDGVAPEPIDAPDTSDLAAPAPTSPGRETSESTFPCPYCGEPVDLFLEPGGSGGTQEFVEECRACGRDFEVSVDYDEAGQPHIRARRQE